MDSSRNQYRSLLPSGTSRLVPNPVIACSVPVRPGESPIAKFFIGGAVTVFFEALGGGHFLEFLKIQKQTTSLSYLQITKHVTQHKGIVGTLDGFLPWGFMQALVKGAVFSFGQAASLKLLNKTSLDRDTSVVLSGGFGGFIQGVVMSPMLLLKTRVMTDAAFRTKGSVVETTLASAKIGARIVSTEGPLALMKGVTVFSTKRFADWTTRYLFVVLVENLMRSSPGQKLSTTEQMTAALLGGTISALVTLPIDVLVATFQQASKAGKKVSVIETYMEQIKKGGVKGTFAFATRGTVARVAHVALTTLLMKTVTSKVYDVLMR